MFVYEIVGNYSITACCFQSWTYQKTLLQLKARTNWSICLSKRYQLHDC